MNIRVILQNLASSFPFLAPVFRFLFRLVSVTMADLNALLFQVQEDDSEEEPTPDELFISDSLTPSERLHNYSSSDLIIHR